MTAQPDLNAPAGRRVSFISSPADASDPANLALHPETDKPRVVPHIESRILRIAYVAFEMAFAATVLIVTLPIMIAIGIYIKLGTPGPALFFHERPGRNGKLFRFVKFRTMYVDAKERFPELYQYDYTPEEIEKLKFKIENDPRVTPQGRWLRKSSLDELPNFWNVLTRDMSLVGPRPESPNMLRYYDDRMLAKFLVRPGVTGFAQTRGRGRLGFLETVEMDLEYLEERSPWTDVKCICRTIWMILRRDGAF